MMMLPVLTTAAILFTSLQVSGGAQTGQAQTFGVQQRTPPRDATVETKGSGIIRGKVVNAEGRPLRRVQLRLSGEAIPEGRTASTNGLGRFEIRELPAGRYTLNASRAGYLGMAYGQTRLGEPGRPIELAEGQAFDTADFVLPHNAIISGRIFDEAGDPLAGANVLTLQMRFFNGKRRLTPVRGNAITDDTGQYRLSGLEPGEYYVQASSRETWEGDPPEKQMLGFVATFFPASPTPAEAQRVRVRAGQEISAIDIGLFPGKVGKVSGTVVNSQGAPLAGENVSMSFEIRGENFMSSYGGQSAKVNPDGTFTFRNVAPADYHLNVRTAATADRPAEGAHVIVSAAGGDVEGVNIVTSPAGAVAGRVVVEGDAQLPSPLSRLTVRVLPVDRETAVNIGGLPDSGRVREDGTFELKSVVGQVRLTIGPLADGWAIRQIEQSDRDLTLQPFDTQGQTLDGVTIKLTNRFPAISGTLRDEKGNSIVAGTTILFPEEPSQWVEDLRAIRTARVDQSGIFTIKAVRPGDYLAVVVPTVTNNQWNDPEYLESLREHAKRVTLKEGEVKQIDLIMKPSGSQ
jgi:carboxypeptidase family protein